MDLLSCGCGSSESARGLEELRHVNIVGVLKGLSGTAATKKFIYYLACAFGSIELA